MILNTGSRTDIPAFFGGWLLNRFREGFVMARNPYRPELVTRYRLDPQAVDAAIKRAARCPISTTHLNLPQSLAYPRYPSTSIVAATAATRASRPRTIKSRRPG